MIATSEKQDMNPRETMTTSATGSLDFSSACSPWRFCIAPMMNWTDRHCRYFNRLLSHRARLYTEMVTTGAVLHGNSARLLRFDAAEHPLALQLGGAKPQGLARAARIGEAQGFDEINLNCGCPSDRVQEGRFGACLMLEPRRVAESVAAMRAAVRIPVTVKCRIGVDDCEDYAFMLRFVDTVAAAGCEVFIIHARKAWLSGLSPRENREIPPLRYELIRQLKAERPRLTIVINGGIRDLDSAATLLEGSDALDGVMLGRAAYEDPWLLAAVDTELFGAPAPVHRREQVLQAMRPYLAAELAAGTPLARISRHLLGLYRGQPGGRAFRRVISQRAHRPDAGLEVLDSALAEVQRALSQAA